MARQAVQNTAPELGLRRELHARGLRYRVHRRPLPELRRQADIVFPTERVAVFVDGCFWHGCPDHKGMPKANEDWWAVKIARNGARDRETDERLREAGWLPIRVWEHEDPPQAAARIAQAVQQRR
jgi:DNA mismatch endonuclease (patch repair protein)